MKHLFTTLFLLCAVAASGQQSLKISPLRIWGQTAIGKQSDNNPYSNVWLEVGPDTTSKAVLLSRVHHLADVGAPLKRGMLTYVYDSAAYCFYDGTSWKKIGTGTGSGGSTDLSSYYTKTQSDSLFSIVLDTASDAKDIAQAAADYVTALDSTKQNVIVLTTSGSSGPATLSHDTLNIPLYAAGSGLGSLNGSTQTSQTFATGTTGTDFGISTNTGTGVHTFNIPTVSGSNRGLVTSSLFNTWQTKQDALVSGTNIKTVNSIPILGSGNLSITTDTTGFGLETRAHATSTYTPLTRILTINGTPLNLSANRSWTIPTLFNGGGTMSAFTSIDGNGQYLQWTNIGGLELGGNGTNPLQIYGHTYLNIDQSSIKTPSVPKIGTNPDSVFTRDGTTGDWKYAKLTLGGGSGTVTSIATTSPITGGTITGTGTIGISNAAADGSTKGASTYTASDFDASSGLISIDYTNGQAADATHKGFLTSADHVNFSSAYTDRLKWDGGGTGLTASTGRTSLGLGTAATLNVPASGDAASGEVVKGNDSRLTDARTPTTHTHTASQVTDFSTAADARITAATGVSVQGYDATTTKNAATQTLTNKDLTSGTNTFPTLNQNTTGSAGSVANALSIGAELISGGASSYNGSAAKSIGIQAGSVTNSMLAGSIGISKLSITGTPTGSKYLRDDGSWQTPAGSGTIATTSSLLKGDGAGNAVAATSGTDYLNPSGDGSGLAMTAGYYLKSATTIVDVYSATAPTSGQILKATSSTAATWQTPSIALGSQVTGTLPVANGGTGQTSLSAVNVGTATALANARNIGGVSFDGTANIALKAELIVAVSDETTALTTGTAKVTFRMPYAMTVTGVRASVNTVSSSGLPTFDIKESGTTILSTLLTIDASEKTSVTAATAAVVSDTSLADDAEMTVDITVAGTGSKGAKIIIYGTRN